MSIICSVQNIQQVCLKVAEYLKVLEQQSWYSFFWRKCYKILLIKKHKNFYPKFKMDFVFVLDYNKYKRTKEKTLENKSKTYSKLDNIQDVLSEETKTISEIGSVL